MADRPPLVRQRYRSPEELFTGRLSFEAVRTGGRRREQIEVMVRLDFVEIFVEGRSRGLVDRDALRLWLARPRQPLVFDEVTVSLVAFIVVLTVGERQYPLPETVQAELHRVG